MDEVIIRAMIAGAILAVALGPLGSFVVWRRMAYFGDAIAHASLLGVALSLMLQPHLPMTAGMVVVALSVAWILTRYVRDSRFHSDTVLGILAHSALALGLVLVALNPTAQVDISAYLFGDVLATRWADVGILALMAIMVLAVLIWRWKRLLITTLHSAIAQVEGIDPRREQLILTALLATVIALAIQLTGILLITALLIIPAASARQVSASAVMMAWMASMFGIVSVAGGLGGALLIDAPAAPMMVVASALLFIVTAAISRVNKRSKRG